MSARRLVVAALCAALATVGCSVPIGSPLPPLPPHAPAQTTVPLPTWTALSLLPGPTSAPATALRVVDYTSPPVVTGTWPPACSARGPLPDPRCTPGSTGNRPRGEVCAVGFEKKVRPSNAEAAKTSAMFAYRVPQSKRSTTELDHLIPLSLGGSNDVTNLWPEVSDLPGSTFRNRKDNVELKLLTAVCHPRPGVKPVSLPAAQSAIARDWSVALTVLGIR